MGATIQPAVHGTLLAQKTDAVNDMVKSNSSQSGDPASKQLVQNAVTAFNQDRGAQHTFGDFDTFFAKTEGYGDKLPADVQKSLDSAMLDAYPHQEGVDDLKKGKIANYQDDTPSFDQVQNQ